MGFVPDYESWRADEIEIKMQAQGQVCITSLEGKERIVMCYRVDIRGFLSESLPGVND